MQFSLPGILGVANAFQADEISIHSAWPGTTGENEFVGGGYVRQPLNLPPATGTDPTRVNLGEIAWTIPAGTVAFYVLWKANSPVAVAANGGIERDVKRILTSGSILCPNHQLKLNQAVVCMGGWPAPFVVGTVYYVVSFGPDVVVLATAPGGTPLKPTTNNYNTTMTLSAINVQTFGEPGTFVLNGIKIRWKWTDTGPGAVIVIPETGFRWLSTRPIPPQEIIIFGGDAPISVLQWLSDEPTSAKIVSNEAEMNALGVTWSEQQGAFVPATTVTPGTVDVVIRASDDLIVDYTGQEFRWPPDYMTPRDLMPRDDFGNHANTGYRASIYWNEDNTKDGVSGRVWSTMGTPGGFEWPRKAGDYDASTPLGSISLTAGLFPEGQTYTINLTTAVKAFADGRFNYGFLLRPGPTSAGRHEFYAREHATASKRPKLLINGTTTLEPESDATLDQGSSFLDGLDVISLAGKDLGQAAGEYKTGMFWFDFDAYFQANNITSGTQITSAVLTLTLFRTRTSGASTYTMYYLFDPATVAPPPILPVGIAWKGTPTGNAQHPTVGLRDENLKFHKDIYWYEDFQNGVDRANWNDFRVYGKDTPDWGLTGATPPGVYLPTTQGDIILDDDNEFPSLGSMQKMYAGQKSLRFYWPGAMSPANHCFYESNLSVNVDTGITIKSIRADGLITLNGSFAGTGTKATWKFGNNPFGEKTFYPRGYAPVYLQSGTLMPLPAVFPAHAFKVVNSKNTAGVAQPNTQVPIGRPYFAECVAGPDQNQFYLCDAPFGNRLIPTIDVNSNVAWTNKSDFAVASPARRLGVTPMSADINPGARNTDGSLRYPAAAPYLFPNNWRAFPQFWYRYYIYVPNEHQCYFQSSKQFGGVDHQYDGMRGMGYGNGGSEGDGVGGSTVRFHSEWTMMSPLGRKGLQFTLYTYCWHPDVLSGYYDVMLNQLPTESATGGEVMPNKFMGWFVEFDHWTCIDYFVKDNSVVPNNEPIFIGDGVTPNYNCVINGQVVPCPTDHACYNPIHAVQDNTIDPATGKARNPFGGAYPNTFRSPIGVPKVWPSAVRNSTTTTTLANGGTRTVVVSTDMSAGTIVTVTTTRDINGVITAQTTSTADATAFKYSYKDTQSITREYELFNPTQRSFWGPGNAQFAMRAAATDPTFRRACIERLPTKMYKDPVTKKSDGIIIVRQNGREVLRWEGCGFRHVDICKDGVTPFRINGPIMTGQEGGVDRDFFEYYMYTTHHAMGANPIGPFALS